MAQEKYVDPASITSFLPANDPVAAARSNLAWIRQAFMLPNLNGTDIATKLPSDGKGFTDEEQRIATTASWSFTDTTMGGSWAINPPPQFCEFADITMGGDQSLQAQGLSSTRTTRTTTGGKGMGRIYHEIIEANSQYVTMSFGVKSFNSLFSFFGSFFDYRASTLARTGRATGLFYNMGSVAGFLLAVPFKPLILASQIVKNAMNIPATKFSYFKPTMPVYWNAVNTIVNGITANLGIHYRQLTKEQQMMYVETQAVGGGGTTSDLSTEIGTLNKWLPDVYHVAKDTSGNVIGGNIDVYAIASRAQRLSDAHIKDLQNALDSVTDEKSLQANLRNILYSGNLKAQDPDPIKNPRSTSELLANYLAGEGGRTTDDDTKSDTESMASGKLDTTVPAPTPAPPPGEDGATPAPTPAPAPAPDPVAPVDDKGIPLMDRIASWFSAYASNLKSTLHDGSQYVTFRTDFGGSIGESFSNSMRASDLEQKINSQSSEARFASYDFAGGNIIGGSVGYVAGKVVDSVKDLVMGVASQVQLSGLAALAGAAYVDIPKMYESSNVSLPTQSFTIELRSWSGHKLALLQNLYIPLAMLLAGVLPRSTGPQSFNGPFSCQLWAKGRMQVRDGLITDMSITRGTGNVGWTKDMQPLGIDVTFTVTDFSSVMHMPLLAHTGFIDKATMAAGDIGGAWVGAAGGAIGAGTNAQEGSEWGTKIASGAISATYTDDSLFSDYLAVLAGLGWKDQIYPFRRWSIARDKSRLDYDSMKSPYRAAAWLAGSWPGQIVSGFVRGTDRP